MHPVSLFPHCSGSDKSLSTFSAATLSSMVIICSLTQWCAHWMGPPFTTFLLALVPLHSYISHYCFKIYHSSGKGYPAFLIVSTKQIANLGISYEPPFSVRVVRWTVLDCLCLNSHTHLLRIKRPWLVLRASPTCFALDRVAGCSNSLASLF